MCASFVMGYGTFKDLNQTKKSLNSTKNVFIDLYSCLTFKVSITVETINMYVIVSGDLCTHIFIWYIQDT